MTLPALAFFIGQQCHLAKRLLRGMHHLRQQAQPVVTQALDGRMVEQGCGVGQARTQALGVLKGIEGQVQLRGLACQWQRLDGQAVAEGRFVRLGRADLMVEHDLEQRVVAEVALRLQGLDQLLERQVLVGLGLQGGGFDLVEQLLERQGWLALAIDDQGVDEEADQVFGLDPVTVGAGHADADVLLAGIAVQHGHERGQQHHERCGLACLGQLAHGQGQGRRDGQRQARTVESLHARAWPVQRQFQHRHCAAQTLAPVVELAFLLAGFHPVALPDGVVGVLQLRFWQLAGQALAEAGVAVGQLIDHHLHRAAVADDVVLHQQQHMVIAAQLQQLGTQ
ncbi:hypothetical protein D3C81_1093390 [compost metagenome]